MRYRSPVMLAELLHPERIRVGLALPDKEAALRAIASLLTMPEATANDEVVYEVLLDRERLASTGVGSGVAIPHGRYDGVEELRELEPIAGKLDLTAEIEPIHAALDP